MCHELDIGDIVDVHGFRCEVVATRRNLSSGCIEAITVEFNNGTFDTFEGDDLDDIEPIQE